MTARIPAPAPARHPPAQARRATILIAHGSRNPAAQSAHAELVDAVRRAISAESGTTDVPLYEAYLEMAEPDIASTIDAAVAAGADEVSLLPCFLHPGNHVANDIPALAAEARERHPGTAVEVMTHLGSEEGIASLLADMITRP